MTLSLGHAFGAPLPHHPSPDIDRSVSATPPWQRHQKPAPHPWFCRTVLVPPQRRQALVQGKPLPPFR